jgi:hypothetical protein
VFLLLLLLLHMYAQVTIFNLFAAVSAQAAQGQG